MTEHADVRLGSRRASFGAIWRSSSRIRLRRLRTPVKSSRPRVTTSLISQRRSSATSRGEPLRSNRARHGPRGDLRTCRCLVHRLRADRGGARARVRSLTMLRRRGQPVSENVSRCTHAHAVAAARAINQTVWGHPMMRTIVERFVEQSPMTIMARLVLQCALHDDWIGGGGRRRFADGESIPRGAVCPRRRRDRIDCRVAADAGCRRGRCARVGFRRDGTARCMSRWRAGWGRAWPGTVSNCCCPLRRCTTPTVRIESAGCGCVLDGSGEAAVPRPADATAGAPVTRLARWGGGRCACPAGLRSGTPG